MNLMTTDFADRTQLYMQNLNSLLVIANSWPGVHEDTNSVSTFIAHGIPLMLVMICAKYGKKLGYSGMSKFIIFFLEIHGILHKVMRA